MSDPFSLTRGIVGLVSQSIKSVQTIQSYISRYKLADLSVNSTRTECSTIRIALLQIQDLLVQKDSGTDTGAKDSFASYATEEYESVLSACSIAFSVLNERLTELNVYGVDKYNESTFISKFNAVWNDDDMNILRQSIRGQAIAINLLLTAFQAGSSAKAYQLLKERKNQRILKTVSDDKRSLLAKSYRAKTMSQKDELESTESIIGDEEFDFDDIVINSAAYRRAYHSYTIKAANTAGVENTKEKQKKEIETGKANNIPTRRVSELIVLRDDDYFNLECQRLFIAIHQWVLRFSKYSDMQSCRLMSEIKGDQVIDRLENSVLDGSNVDNLLADKFKRQDVFMAVVVSMIWEFVFTRYLFGLDREGRQRLKSLENVVWEVGPRSTVRLWRALTLTLVSKKESFIRQSIQDTNAVTHAVFETLTEILPPSSQLDIISLEESLRTVVKSAVDLSVAMRTQLAEYLMLPPLLPEYDANDGLASKVSFNAALMDDQSGSRASKEDLEIQGAIVKLVLFPLITKKGDDSGVGDDETVVYPAQVVVSRKAESVSILSNKSMISVASNEIGIA